MFSTITTVPSTTMPKSRAPKDRRFAGIFRRSRQIDAKRSEKGIVSATMRAARIFPRKRRSTTVTRMRPSVRLWRTVSGRIVDEVAPVVERHDLDAGRQDAAVQLLDFLVDGLQGRVETGAFPHEDDAGDDVVVVDDLPVFPMDGPAELAEAYLRALGDDSDVLDAHGRAVLRRDDRILDVCPSCARARPRAR